jgi:hypothetical protein
VIGANVNSLKEISLWFCPELSGREPNINIGSILVPLLKNPKTKTIELGFAARAFTRSSDIPIIKAAFQSNQGLEELCIGGTVGIEQLDVLALLFQAIAAAPNLRTLQLRTRGMYSPQEQCEAFAMALKDSKNSTLESVDFMNLCSEISWIREVAPILKFNSERRRFEKFVSGCSEEERLLQAVTMLADNTNNRHLCYWLLRNHAGALQRGKTV